MATSSRQKPSLRRAYAPDEAAKLAAIKLVIQQTPGSRASKGQGEPGGPDEKQAIDR